MNYRWAYWFQWCHPDEVSHVFHITMKLNLYTFSMSSNYDANEPQIPSSRPSHAVLMPFHMSQLSSRPNCLTSSPLSAPTSTDTYPNRRFLSRSRWRLLWKIQLPLSKSRTRAQKTVTTACIGRSLIIRQLNGSRNFIKIDSNLFVEMENERIN